MIADRVAVMGGGEIVELGGVGQIFKAPAKEYTQKLLKAIPVPVPRRPPAAAPTGSARRRPRLTSVAIGVRFHCLSTCAERKSRACGANPASR